jgi:hypothetical protein
VRLTIVGGVREARLCRRVRGKRLCARGSNRALLGGPSTSPLAAMVSTSTTASVLCEIPTLLRANSHKSLAKCLEEIRASGAPAVTEQDLVAVLASRSDLIDAWVAYSEDQRSSDAWYLVPGSPSWVVGHRQPRREFEFKEPAAACAAFIARRLGKTTVKWSAHGS